MTRTFPCRLSLRLRALAGNLVYWDAWVGAGRPSVVLTINPDKLRNE